MDAAERKRKLEAGKAKFAEYLKRKSGGAAIDVVTTNQCNKIEPEVDDDDLATSDFTAELPVEVVSPRRALPVDEYNRKMAEYSDALRRRDEVIQQLTESLQVTIDQRVALQDDATVQAEVLVAEIEQLKQQLRQANDFLLNQRSNKNGVQLELVHQAALQQQQQHQLSEEIASLQRHLETQQQEAEAFKSQRLADDERCRRLAEDSECQRSRLRQLLERHSTTTSGGDDDVIGRLGELLDENRKSAAEMEALRSLRERVDHLAAELEARDQQYEAVVSELQRHQRKEVEGGNECDVIEPEVEAEAALEIISERTVQVALQRACNHHEEEVAETGSDDDERRRLSDEVAALRREIARRDETEGAMRQELQERYDADVEHVRKCLEEKFVREASADVDVQVAQLSEKVEANIAARNHEHDHIRKELEELKVQLEQLQADKRRLERCLRGSDVEPEEDDNGSDLWEHSDKTGGAADVYLQLLMSVTCTCLHLAKTIDQEFVKLIGGGAEGGATTDAPPPMLTSGEDDEEPYSMLPEVEGLLPPVHEEEADGVAAEVELEPNFLSLLSDDSAVATAADAERTLGEIVSEAGSRLANGVQRLLELFAASVQQLHDAKMAQEEQASASLRSGSEMAVLASRHDELSQQLKSELETKQFLALELTKASEALRSCQAERERHEDLVARADRQVAQLRCQLDDAHARVRALEADEEKEAETEVSLQHVVVEGLGEHAAAATQIVIAARNDAQLTLTSGEGLLLEENSRLQQEKRGLQQRGERDRSELTSRVHELEQALDEMALEHESVAERERQLREDLQQQVDALEKQLRAYKHFIEEQTGEREQEREDFQRELKRLGEIVRERERSLSSGAELLREAEGANEQLREKERLLAASEERKEQLESDLKALSEKLNTCQEVVRELERQLDCKSRNERELQEEVDELRSALSSSARAQQDQSDEIELLRHASVSHGGATGSGGHFLFDDDDEVDMTLVGRDPTKTTPEVLLLLHELRALDDKVALHVRELESTLVVTSSAPGSPCSEEVSVRDRAGSRPEDVRGALRRLDERVDALSRAKEAALRRCSELDALLRNRKQAEEELLQDRDVLQQQLNAQLLHVSALQSRLEQQRLFPAEQQRHHESKMAAVAAEQEAQVEQLERRVRELEERCERNRSERSELEKQLLLSGNEAAENRKRADDVSSLLQTLLHEKNAELDRSAAEVERLAAERSELEAVAERLRSESASLSERLAASEREQRRAADTLEQKRREVEALKLVLEEKAQLLEEKRVLQAELDNVNAYQARLQEDFDTVQSMLEEKQAEAAAALHELAESELNRRNEIESLLKQKAATECRYVQTDDDARRQQQEEAEAEVQRLKQLLEEARAETERLAQQVSHAEAEVAWRNNKIFRLEDQLIQQQQKQEPEVTSSSPPPRQSAVHKFLAEVQQELLDEQKKTEPEVERSESSEASADSSLGVELPRQVRHLVRSVRREGEKVLDLSEKSTPPPSLGGASWEVQMAVATERLRHQGEQKQLMNELRELDVRMAQNERQHKRQVELLRFRVQQEQLICDDVRQTLELEKSHCVELRAQLTHEKGRAARHELTHSQLRSELLTLRSATEQQRHELLQATQQCRCERAHSESLLRALRGERSGFVRLQEAMEAEKRRALAAQQRERQVTEELRAALVTAQSALLQQQSGAVKPLTTADCSNDTCMSDDGKLQRVPLPVAAADEALEFERHRNRDLDGALKKERVRAANASASLQRERRQLLQELDCERSGAVRLRCDLEQLQAEKESVERELERSQQLAARLETELERTAAEAPPARAEAQQRREELEALRQLYHEAQRNFELERERERHTQSDAKLAANKLQQRVALLEKELEYAGLSETQLQRELEERALSGGRRQRHQRVRLEDENAVDERYELAGVETARQRLVILLSRSRDALQRLQSSDSAAEEIGALLEAVESLATEVAPPLQPTAERHLALTERVVAHNAQLAELARALCEEKLRLRLELLSSAADHCDDLPSTVATHQGPKEQQQRLLSTERAAWASERAQLQRALHLAESELLRLRSSCGAGRSGSRPTDEVRSSSAAYFRLKYLHAQSYRNSLVYQKNYLTALLSGYRRTEAATLSALDRLGCLSAPPLPVPPLRRFRSAALVAVAVRRMRYLVAKWRKLRPYPVPPPPSSSSSRTEETEEPEVPQPPPLATPTSSSSSPSLAEFVQRFELLQQQLGLAQQHHHDL